MNIVMGIGQRFLKEAIGLELIPEGMVAVTIESLEELTELLPDISQFAILDEDLFKRKEMLEAIHLIKKKPDGNKAKIIVLTKNTLQSYIKVLQTFGVDLIIQSSLNEESIAFRIINFVKNVCDKNKDMQEKRKYVRLSLQDNQNSSLKIFVPEISSYLEAKLTDISMGGVAVAFQNNKLGIVNNNMNYKRAQIKLDANTIFADMRLVKRSDAQAAFQFTHINDNYKKMLAGFIFHKIQQCLSR